MGEMLRHGMIYGASLFEDQNLGTLIWPKKNISDYASTKFKLSESYLVSHTPNLELELGWNILSALELNLVCIW